MEWNCFEIDVVIKRELIWMFLVSGFEEKYNFYVDVNILLVGVYGS